MLLQMPWRNPKRLDLELIEASDRQRYIRFASYPLPRATGFDTSFFGARNLRHDVRFPDTPTPGALITILGVPWRIVALAWDGVSAYAVRYDAWWSRPLVAWTHVRIAAAIAERRCYRWFARLLRMTPDDWCVYEWTAFPGLRRIAARRRRRRTARLASFIKQLGVKKAEVKG